MSMQIGVIPIRPAHHQDMPNEKVAVKQAEARAAALASLPSGARPAEKKTVEIQSAVHELEQVSLAFSRKLEFVVDHDSQEVIVKVIDSETDKVIKVLPPEELQRLHQRIKDTMGFLFDQRV